MTNLIVQLKIYKGKEAYNREGKLISDSQLMKLKYDVLEWTNFIKSAKFLGYSKVEVIKCLNGNESKIVNHVKQHPEVEIPQEVLDSVAKCLTEDEVVLTPEEKIKQLEARIDAMAKPKERTTEHVDVSKTPEKVEATNESDDDDLEDARQRYREAFEGQDPHPLAKVKRINQLIAEKSE